MLPFDSGHDPYKRCERHCNHDLARGVTMEDLLDHDGPYNPLGEPALLVPMPGSRVTTEARLAG